MEGRPSQSDLFEESLTSLERAVSAYEGSEPQRATAGRFEAFLYLHRRIESLTSCIAERNRKRCLIGDTARDYAKVLRGHATSAPRARARHLVLTSTLSPNS